MADVLGESLTGMDDHYTLCVNWFNHEFVLDARKRCQDLDLPFKVALVLDSTPGHAKLLVGHHLNLSVVFPPFNLTSLMQPQFQVVPPYGTAKISSNKD